MRKSFPLWDPRRTPTGPQHYEPNPKLPLKPSGRALRWADRHVLGGRRAYREYWSVLWASIREGRRRVVDKRDRERAVGFFDTLEAVYDDSLFDAVSFAVLPVDGESAAAYDARLADYVRHSRLRLDTSGLSIPTSSVATGARASDAPPTAEVVVLLKRQAKAARRAYYATYRKNPTPEELAAWVRAHPKEMADAARSDRGA